MPLPKNNIDEWKRDIGFRKLLNDSYGEEMSKGIVIKIDKTAVEIGKMTDGQLVEVHSKLHAIRFDMPSSLKEKDVGNLHGSIAVEYSKRCIKHPKIDELDG